MSQDSVLFMYLDVACTHSGLQTPSVQASNAWLQGMRTMHSSLTEAYILVDGHEQSGRSELHEQHRAVTRCITPTLLTQC